MLDREHTVAVTLPTFVRVLMPHGHVEEMKLETYLAGVVATEIGASAPLEALKAQAVASRTYAAAAHRHPEHDADVCTTAHCQKWKRVDPVVAPEVFRALSETWGMVAVHDGKLIDAFFFEHCDGHTRNSEEMLMPTIKYLRGVDCSCGFLSLKGHGVGMCKRGAIVMARRGASFEQILRHYYRGIVVIHTARENHAAVEAEPAAPAAPAPAPEPKPRVRAQKAPAASAPPAAKPEPEKRARHKPPRPLPRRTPRREEAPVAAPPPAEVEKAEAETIVEARVQPPAPVQPKLEKLRDVLVGEVVPKSEPAVAEPPKPTKPPRRVHIDHLPGSRMIAGCLPEAGVSILIEDPQGNKMVMLSGSAEHYGAGGFEMMVDADGRYLVTLDDQVIEVHISGETVFIHVA
jgi:hypothetical protein